MDRSGALRLVPVTLCAALVAAAVSLSGCSSGGGGSSGGGSSGGSPDVTITTNSLPSGQVGDPYTATLAASGGHGPYTWSLAAGTLPSGLSLNAATGVLAGFPSVPVNAMALSITVTDSSKPAQINTATLPLTITPPPLTIGNTSLPNGQVGTPYSVTLNATGGSPPYSWSITSGSLPADLSLNAATGVLSGPPTQTVQAMPLTVQVKDSEQPAQVSPAALTLTITPPPIIITTTSLPCGQVGVAYSASLQASQGTKPYIWTLTSGSLDGLSLSTAGALSGIPAATVSAAPLTFQVTDAGSPQQTANVAMTLTVGAMGTAVCLMPARAALTVTQTLSVTASTADASDVSWSMSPAGGSIPATSHNSQPVTLTAPATAGVYTLTATSVVSGAQASLVIGVTDLPAVATWHNDLARDGVNAQEYALTTTTVKTATFGKLFSCPVDGAVYAQPLWVANVGGQHNVVVVATQHDSVYAFDADASPCVQLWHANLLDAGHGAGATGVEMPVPSQSCSGPANCYIGQGLLDIEPEVGVTGTPVIDPPSLTNANGTIYVVSKSVVDMGSPGTSSFYQRLHALDLTTGDELGNAPATISATYPGTPQCPTVPAGTVTFSARQQNQRAGLALLNGTVYVAWGSHEDAAPYFGWLLGYTYSSMGFAAPAVFNTSPTACNGGIWMAGAAPSADDNGHLYVIASNGQFDVDSGGPDYGDSFLQLTPAGTALNVSSYFTPADQLNDFTADNDAGSGGAAVVLNLGAGGPGPQHLVVGGGKDGTVFVLNGDSMGGYLANGGNANAWQSFSLSVPPSKPAIFSSGAFWNNTYYLAAAGSALLAFPFDTTALTFDTSAVNSGGGSTVKSPEAFGFPGATPSISSSGPSSNGIVWALSTSTYCLNGGGCGPAILRAYDATNLNSEIWNSTKVSGDAAGNAVKFTVPTVANGKVYVGTRGNNNGSIGTINGELDVYGLKPN